MSRRIAGLPSLELLSRRTDQDEEVTTGASDVQTTPEGLAVTTNAGARGRRGLGRSPGSAATGLQEASRIKWADALEPTGAHIPKAAYGAKLCVLAVLGRR